MIRMGRRSTGRGNSEPIVAAAKGPEEKRKLNFWLTTSAPESAPLPIATSREGPARETPAVIPPFLGLLGLEEEHVSIVFQPRKDACNVHGEVTARTGSAVVPPSSAEKNASEHPMLDHHGKKTGESSSCRVVYLRNHHTRRLSSALLKWWKSGSSWSCTSRHRIGHSRWRRWYKGWSG